ncbi:MAG: ABC transporter permease [Clostridiales Family XIII bacterium]|nr:ABC transporter permease [Clostridiales Family XIII bacterium]
MKTIIGIIKDHVEWRSQIFKLAKSDIIKTYSGAALGWSWMFISPAINIFVFWFAFSIGLKQGSDVPGYSFLLWLLPGYVPWFFMNSMLSGGAGVLRKYSYLVTKVKFPISTIPTFVGLSKIAVHIILMAIVVLIFVIHGKYPDIYYLQIPIYMALMRFAFTMWSQFSSMLAAISKDFLNLVKAMTTAVFWMSGIIWNIDKIDDSQLPWLKTVLMFNPVTYFATGYRNCMVYKKWIWDEPIQFLCFMTTVVVVIILSIWVNRKLVKVIPDVL